MSTISTAPEGFAPNYDPTGTLVDHVAPAVNGNGYWIDRRWTPERGLVFYVVPDEDGITPDQAHDLSRQLFRLAR